MIFCSPVVLHHPWLFCWVEPLRKQNPHLSQQIDRTLRYVEDGVSLCVTLLIDGYSQAALK